MLPGAPTQFTGGVGNSLPGSFGALVPFPYPAQYYSWFTDFDRFNALTTGSADWVLTGTNVAVANAQITDAENGILSFATAAVDADGIFAQWHGGNATTDVAETFKFTAGKELWCSARFSLSDVTDEAFLIGLAVADTTPIDAVDGVFFRKADLSTTLQLVSTITGPTVVSANLLTMAASTFYEIGYHYNGIDAVRAYLRSNGTWESVGSVGVSALPTTELAVTMALLNGSAGAKTALIDYLFVAKER